MWTLILYFQIQRGVISYSNLRLKNKYILNKIKVYIESTI